MSIIRSPRPESNFYVLDKSISENDRLTWAARGVLIFLLGKPDHWQVSVEHLKKQTESTRKPTGRDGIYSVIDELIEAGYMKRQQNRGEDGKVKPFQYFVSDIPLTAQPDTVEPDTAGTTLVSIDTKQEKKIAIAPKAQTLPKVSFIDGQFSFNDDKVLSTWESAYGKDRVSSEIARAAAWVVSTGSAKKNWSRFLNNWLANSKAVIVDESGCPVDKIIDMYHEECPSMPGVTVRDDKVLRAMIVDRWRESEAHQAGRFWQKIFSRAKRRSEVFYRGQKCAPRLEAIVSRSVFRELEEMSV